MPLEYGMPPGFQWRQGARLPTSIGVPLRIVCDIEILLLCLASPQNPVGI